MKLPKLRTYVTFKTRFGTKDYVRYCLSRQTRSYIAQFRLGILPINIEVRRFRNIPLEDRKCDFCTVAVEDAMHFLMDCTLYNIERTKLFTLASQKNMNFEYLPKDKKFIWLMQNVWKEASKCIHCSFENRSNLYM